MIYFNTETETLHWDFVKYSRFNRLARVTNQGPNRAPKAVLSVSPFPTASEHFLTLMFCFIQVHSFFLKGYGESENKLECFGDARNSLERGPVNCQLFKHTKFNYYRKCGQPYREPYVLEQ